MLCLLLFMGSLICLNRIQKYIDTDDVYDKCVTALLCLVHVSTISLSHGIIKDLCNVNSHKVLLRSKECIYFLLN